MYRGGKGPDLISVAVDVRKIHDSGIGTYIRQVIPRVILGSTDIHFFLLGRSNDLRALGWDVISRVTLVDCRSATYSVEEQFELLFKTPRQVDLFWSPHYNIPVFLRKRLLVTVYDVCHLALPETCGGIHRRLYARLMFGAVRLRARRILTISEFSKAELIRLARVPAGQVDMVHLAVDRFWFSAGRPERPHPRPYFLFVGNVKPNKNIITLLSAFRSLTGSLPHDLIIVGRKDGFRTNDGRALAAAEELGDRVAFTGRVSDNVLRDFYFHADALVFPSLYEGFGLPPLEAMASRCPTIVSNAASLPEVCGDASLYCDPRDPADLARQMHRLVCDKDLQDGLRNAGMERASSFTWDECGDKTNQVLRRVLDLSELDPGISSERVC